MMLLMVIVGLVAFGALMFWVMDLCTEDYTYYDCRWGEDE